MAEKNRTEGQVLSYKERNVYIKEKKNQRQISEVQINVSDNGAISSHCVSLWCSTEKFHHCQLALRPHGEQHVFAGIDTSEANEAAVVRGTYDTIITTQTKQ